MPIAYGLLSGNMWIYTLAFVLLALYPVLKGGLLLYHSIDDIVALLAGKTQAALNQVPSVSKSKSGKCPKCGEQNAIDVLFCGRCGADLREQKEPEPVENKCPVCNTVNPLTSKFCVKCGNPLKKN